MFLMVIILTTVFVQCDLAVANIQDTVHARNQILVVQFEQQKLLKTLQNPLVSNGEIIVWPKKGVIWHTKHPFPNTLIIKRQGVFACDNAQLQPLSDNSQTQEISNFISKIMQGNLDVNTNLNGFEVKKQYNNKTDEWDIQLMPNHPQLKKLLEKIKLRGNQHIQFIQIEKKSGDIDKIYLTQHKTYDVEQYSRVLTKQQQIWLNDENMD